MADPVTDPFKQVFRKDASIVARQIAGEMILVPIRQNMGDLESIYLLNQTARFAWNLFDGRLTLAEVRDQVTHEFDVEEAQAGEDLLELTSNLLRLGALAKP